MRRPVRVRRLQREVRKAAGPTRPPRGRPDASTPEPRPAPDGDDPRDGLRLRGRSSGFLERARVDVRPGAGRRQPRSGAGARILPGHPLGAPGALPGPCSAGLAPPREVPRSQGLRGLPSDPARAVEDVAPRRSVLARLLGPAHRGRSRGARRGAAVSDLPRAALGAAALRRRGRTERGLQRGPARAGDRVRRVSRARAPAPGSAPPARPPAALRPAPARRVRGTSRVHREPVLRRVPSVL